MIYETAAQFFQQAYTWEASYARSWETVQEDEAGSLQTSVEELMARGRRKRYSDLVTSYARC
jgi:transcription initiation factor TFIIH subunit 2